MSFLKKVIYFFVPFLVWASPRDDLLVSMRKEMDRIAVTIPSTATTLMTNLQTAHAYKIAASSPDTLDELITTWKLPTDVTALLQQAAFATTENFQTFTFTASPSYTFFEEYLGASKFVDGIVTIAYMHVNATAKPIQQTRTISVRTCHKCWLVLTCCSSANAVIPRGVTAAEIEIMMTTLRATAFKRLESDFPTTTFLNYRVLLGLPEDM